MTILLRFVAINSLIFTSLSSHAEQTPAYMGNWEGSWTNPKDSAWKRDPGIVARVVGLGNDTYEIQLLQEFYIRANPYVVVEAKAKDGVIEFKEGDWAGKITEESFTGTHTTKKHTSEFSLREAPVVSPTLGLEPPSDAIVLFDGSNLNQWEHQDKSGKVVSPTWKIVDGVLECYPKKGGNKQGGDLYSKERFKSFKMHLEFRIPYEPASRGQGRGNSGVFINEKNYEVQILDSYGLNGFWNECGALYKVSPPKVNAVAPPGTWQTYDITFQISDGTNDPIITVLQNGINIHNAQVITSVCSHAQVIRRNKEHQTVAGRIALQDHGHPMQFRNIWVQPIE